MSLPIISPESTPAAPPTHEHGWVTSSRHRTSEGTVVYVHCLACGAHRVDLIPLAHSMPVPLSAPTLSDRA